MDAVVDVYHGEEGLGLKEALVGTLLKCLKEDLYKITFRKISFLQVEYMAVPLKAYFSDEMTPG